MKIASAAQVRDLDKATIEKEPISSYDLMERASKVFAVWFAENFSEDCPVWIVCGKGNNGGDGLAVARLLQKRFFSVQVLVGGTLEDKRSDDNRKNLERLLSEKYVPVKFFSSVKELPAPEKEIYLIDALFGSGLNRPIEGFWQEVVQWFNHQPGKKIAIDMPSGLMADQPSVGDIIHADHTLTFELPKLAFLFPENAAYPGKWEVASIDLYPSAIEALKTPYHLLEKAFVSSLLKERNAFDHKGTFGHSLIIAGGYGKMGAAILAGKGSLRSGCGLVSIHSPRSGYEILQIAFPEAMVSVDRHQFVFTDPPNLSPYKAIGFGCGIGTNLMTAEGLKHLLSEVKVPLVIDADGLNIIAENKALLEMLPKGTVLTPHPGEFSRLFGQQLDSFDRLSVQINQAKSLGVIIILKGAYTSIAFPDGQVYFNTTGNPGMGTGGSGDVLTGILTGLLAQGYTPEHAALLGAYLHGLSGDIALQEGCHESLLASDLLSSLGKAFRDLKN